MYYNIKAICLALLVTILPALSNAASEVRNIEPPKLDKAHLGKEILCHRPMRLGRPKMTIENTSNKIIANNYGHGGSGWTLAPGAAIYVNDLLINSPDAADLSKNTSITIVGAGVIGLYTAYDLYERGYTDITIIAEKFDNLTSHNAGGLLAPVSMKNEPDIQAVIDKISIDAYKFYQLVATSKHPHFKKGAIIMPSYFSDREGSGLEPYVGVVMQPAKDVVLDFGNGTKHNMVAYDDGIFIDTAEMMESLNNYVKSKNIKFVQKKINSFNNISTKYVINCSGMGAKELNKDEEMVSVQGHLIMLKDQKPANLQYMIIVYFDEDKTESGQKIKRSFYMFPKHLAGNQVNDIGVIGGTFIEDATPKTPNKKEFDIMIQNAKNFYGIK